MINKPHTYYYKITYTDNSLLNQIYMKNPKNNLSCNKKRYYVGKYIYKNIYPIKKLKRK
jgi:hypothetical protein